MTPEQIRILKQIADLIVQAIAETGKVGMPAGTLYAALMAQGCTMSMFDQIMAGLVSAKKVEKRGQLYFAITSGGYA